MRSGARRPFKQTKSQVSQLTYWELKMGFFSWHRQQTQWWLDQLGMSPYAGLWFAYFKGIATALIGLWLLEGL